MGTRLLVALLGCIVIVGPTPIGSGVARAEPPSGVVRAVRGAAVYVDLGRVHGVRVGDVLPIGGARLEVVHLGEKQLMAKVVSGAAPKPGSGVLGLRDPAGPGGAAGRPTRPVVTLPPVRPARPLPWRDEAAHRTAMVPPPAVARATTPGGPRGDILLGWSSLFDDGPGDLELHRVELRTRLALTAPAEGGLGYRHDLAARAELGPGLDARAGSGSRPYYRIRELALGWSSAGQGTTRLGVYSAELGRVRVWDTTSPGVVDGARADVALGAGVTAGIYGGLVPAVLDTRPGADSAVVGAHVAWDGRGDDWRARAALTSALALWQGAVSRLDVGASGLVSLGRGLDLHTSLVATAVDAGLVSGGQPALSLTRGYLGARVRPLWWLTIDGSFAHERFVADRELAARLGADAFDTAPRESAWLQLRFDPSAQLSWSVSGTLGLGEASAQGQGGATRLVLRDVGLAGLRTAVGYRYSQTPVVRAHVVDVDVGLDVGPVLLDLGYGFSTFTSQLLDERQDEHRVTAGVDLITRGPWRVLVRGFLARGTEPGQLGVDALLQWRFR